ncbi:MAG: hypothetical protein ACQEXJ_06255 [Myxococcota bacterium]
MDATTLTPSERDALVRFRPDDDAGQVESLFLKLNLPEGRALWLKITFLKRTFGRREALAEAWAIAFGMGEGGGHVALKSTWPASEASWEEDCLFVRVGDVQLSQGRAVGALDDEETGERISWDLTFTTEHEGFRHLPADWMYEGPIPKTKPNSPQIDARFDGTLTVGDRTTKVEGAPGMFGHNWGSQQAESWTWVHCNRWEGVEGVVFEGVTSRVKMGPVTAPLATVLHVRIPGERITINGFLDLWTTKSEPEGLGWRFSGRKGDRKVEGWFHAPPERFVGVDYHDPDGRIAHCLNTKIADGELAVYGRGDKGWSPLLTAVCDRSAALEVGLRGSDTLGVPIRIR